MAHRYRMPAGCDPELWSLVKPPRTAMREQGLSQAQLGPRLRCDRSRVSRALSAREVPPRHLIVQIAEALGADVAAVQQRRARNDARRRNARARTTACAAGGGPPPALDTYPDLLRRCAAR